MSPAPTESLDSDEQLAILLERMAEEASSGQLPDVSAICAEHPELAGELRNLWGAVMVADAAALGRQLDSPNDAVTSRDSGSDIPPYTSPDPALPKLLGDYELVEELGRGGMGVVYKARQQSLDRTVALKLILRGEMATPEQTARFQTEAEAAAQLDHPAIVPIFECGEAEGQPFFSMAYVEGQTLSERLADGPLPSKEAVRIVREVARAIDYAHQQGIMHRDLKPSNIVLDQAGRPHVTDFGLAKRTDGSHSLTATGAVLGTPSYIAPEQAAGSRGTLGPPADIYSLGTILFALVTGRPPFQGPSPLDTVLMVLEQDPPLPHVLNHRVDRDLEMIILRCLQKPPDLRYPSAAALANDLDAYLKGEPVAARSGQFSHVLARVFGEKHHAVLLENWGLVWMWHALVLVVLCAVTNIMHALRVTIPQMDTPLPYLILWGGGLAVWAPTFWAIRRRAGPVTAVERHIAHAWGASVIGVMLLFVVEYLLRLPVLTLSPVLGVLSGMVFVVKAGILSGQFYFYAAALFATSIVMAYLQARGYEFGITLYGFVSASTFFLPGLKYWRQRQQR